MLVEVDDEVLLRLQLPLQLLREHVVGVALLVHGLLLALHVVVRLLILMIIQRPVTFMYSIAQHSGTIRAVGLDYFHNGQKSAA